jgi:riboflavin biosynthesis pyrimidine reductase
LRRLPFSNFSALNSAYLSFYMKAAPLFGKFVANGCVDELFLTIAPQVANRNRQPLRPGLIAGVEFLPEAAPWLDIVSVKERGNHLYLRYSAV